LNLAALHFRLGHTDLAFAAIGETVRAAQQNSDHACMAFALGWLSQLLTLTGDPQAEEILFRCLTRAACRRARRQSASGSLEPAPSLCGRRDRWPGSSSGYCGATTDLGASPARHCDSRGVFDQRPGLAGCLSPHIGGRATACEPSMRCDGGGVGAVGAPRNDFTAG
jgi:hypothetical protein